MPPKGHLEKGESPELAALREVEEEIGWKLTHVDSNRFFDVPYIDKKGVTYKTVRCFVVELESEDPDNNGPHLKRVAGLQKEEVDEIRWFNRTEVATYALPRYVEFIKAVL
jgi:8-oxo-dGTP pyrophosphatase MutT (NUDIX family)